MHRASNRALINRKRFLRQQSARISIKALRCYFFFVKKDFNAMKALDTLVAVRNQKGIASIKDACIITGRSRRVTSINISRMQVRKFLMMGAIKGLKKHYW